MWKKILKTLNQKQQPKKSSSCCKIEIKEINHSAQAEEK
ncbi:hypothetical protein BpOF4_02700 [Alkalihalophilus pseudofirmus OF4]|uniref:Uncharacterized protein n=1 Tax=Alkalihalophilus pseudofirmus (strain ATCC BAA-2126 / JCM 17055 / OF4) TaxID=398511 RepID=D3FW75_ALKPO|nr:hypothetical protein BpOF4_02700 [Alkalihalophilus pseudofirmus OF4]